MLTGKQLLLEELPFPRDEILKHHQHGYLVYRKGINREPISCTRCGTTDHTWFAEIPCSRCGKVEFYCRKCLMMGRVSECTPLVSWAGPNPDFKRITEPLHWDGQLSAGQNAASRRVLEAVENSSELLIWAVAGQVKRKCYLPGLPRPYPQASGYAWLLRGRMWFSNLRLVFKKCSRVLKLPLFTAAVKAATNMPNSQSRQRISCSAFTRRLMS
ncbi:ComF operon protein A [Mesobacillus boroniphilus JCM 21738]|uniref:ComF operon protein A n=1 Tax=Mesobacillus boroniphilus JCM 21738 TaxID=1294265 RepID=W4RIV7_9BACI|nr:ComF operon protein A [Mesobacillus boroniphilus JCM 21738]